ncbi:MAG: 3-hydroxybutyryl-CoA dehydrogenase [Candidatus Korarchaeota archaeon]|nr:3-hydroxybutyryl-CoA dehydrogenase [Candidatus Korarchaeota archaeon]NIU84617.1 3-hydroxybutyryl-CoA dehydrogenase [Candidatus Thorarchaeota archaeon]NIW12759.1 3-hydroxybutyryl-CoA dehydrogenase [Candidatus Thorarchaeota archaeon]NIW50967.1 3-hydroxybutyryl-CoA dehydrogenase [Candidatus Korarchaeota archaeon]
MKDATVIGAGTMGHGITQLLAMKGYKVTLLDIETEILEKAMSKIEQSLSKFEEKGSIEDASEVMGNIHSSLYDPKDHLEPFKNAVKDINIAIEAVYEKLAVKREIFELLDRLTPKNAILASNTSSLPITEIAKATKTEGRVIGMHFFNPPQILKLIEVVKGEKTTKETVEKVITLARKLEKKPVVVKKDVPGFIVNRILIRLLNEACATLERGKINKEAIDAALKYNAGIPMGAFELLDYSGVDVFYALAKAMKKRGFNITIAKSLRKKVEAEEYGRKTGKGFYDYQKEKKPNISKEKADEADFLALFAPAVNEAAWIVRNEVATRGDVNVATKFGLNYPKGLVTMAKGWGIEPLKETLKRKAKEYGEEYKPDPFLDKLLGG